MITAWGKPKILIYDLDAESPKWQLLPTPVEDSTSLTTSKGDKKEAKIEGGENEDVKYTKNTYALELEIRATKGRKQPMSDDDGVISHNYAVALQPEDPSCPGFCFLKSAPSLEDTFSASDGGSWKYTFDALKSAQDKKQIYWGVITIKGTDDNITAVTCDPIYEDGSADAFDVATGEKATV